MYKKGLGVTQDLKEAFNWYMKAAIQDWGDSQYQLGQMYEDGIEVKQNAQEAIKWYKKAIASSELGNMFAQERLEKLYLKLGMEAEAISLHRKETERGIQRSHANTLTQAQIGNVEAQCAIAQQYLYAALNRPDELARLDYEEALRWYKKAADQGYVEALFQAGEMYRFKDDKEAFKWYMEAAKKGHKKACKRVAYMYGWGCGVERNFEEEKKWKEKSW
jgi:TPR repeat protein